MIRRLLSDPQLFAYVIMALYLTQSGWSVWHGNRFGALYWLSALCITAVVTFVPKGWR